MMLKRKAESIFDRALDVLAVVCYGIIIFLLLSVTVDVVLRYFFNSPTIWVTEVSEYALLYLTFLGTAWLLRREGHVQVDVVVSRLGARAQALLGVISSLIGLLISLALVWYGVEVTWDHILRGVPVTSTLEPPKALLLAVLPLGGMTLLIQFLRRTRAYLAAVGTVPLRRE